MKPHNMTDRELLRAAQEYGNSLIVQELAKRLDQRICEAADQADGALLGVLIERIKAANIAAEMTDRTTQRLLIGIEAP